MSKRGKKSHHLSATYQDRYKFLCLSTITRSTPLASRDGTETISSEAAPLLAGYVHKSGGARQSRGLIGE